MDERSHGNINDLLNRAASVRDPVKAQHAFHRARSLMQQCQVPGPYTGGYTREPACVPHSNIQMDAVHPPLAGDYCQPMLAPSRILVVEDIPAVEPQQTTPGERLEFSAGGGWIIGWRGSAIDYTTGAFRVDALTQASIGVRLTFNGEEEIITNGQSLDFVRYSDVFPATMNYAPMLRRVDVKDILITQCRNYQPAAPLGHTLNPTLAFQFWREKYPGANG